LIELSVVVAVVVVGFHKNVNIATFVVGLKLVPFLTMVLLLLLMLVQLLLLILIMLLFV